jgi:Baseplate J-like protein
MTAITFAQASTPSTQAALLSQALISLATSNSPVAGWSKYAPQYVLLNDWARNMAAETSTRATLASMLDLSVLANADPDWVDAFVTWFGETRIPAIAAVWAVPISATSLPLTVQPTDAIVLQATGGQFFQLSQGNTVQLPQAGLEFTARTPGTVGNVAASSITKIVSGPPGLTITGTPTLYTVGRDIETPGAAIARCVAKWGILGAGWTNDAFDYWIPTTAPTITRWLVRDDNPLGPGTTLAILADAAGPATTAEVAAIQAKMGARNVRPLGSSTFLAMAAGLDALTLNIVVKGDGTNGSLQAAIIAGLSALAAPYAIGPAILSLDIVRSVALGAAYPSIDVDDGSGNLSTLVVQIPGFTGAGEIVSCDLAASHTVPGADVLVLTPNVTVV